MKKTTVLAILVLNFVYSVECGDVEEVKQRSLNGARQYYKYNHPPATEEIVPVAVVYDKVIDRYNRGRKSERIKEIKPTISSPEKLLVINETKIVNAEKVLSTEDYVKSGNRNSESKNLKLELKIPVSVVYDEGPGVIKRNRIKTAVGTRLRKPVKSQRNPNIQNKEKPSTDSKAKDDMEKLKVEKTNVLEKKTLDKMTAEEKNNGNIKVESVNQEITGQKKNRQVANENKRPHGDPDPIVPIVASENRVLGHNGEFTYSYEGGDGTKAFSAGKLKTFEEELAGEAVEGGFSYKDKEGNDFSLTYTADENGYRPVGAHLPTPPPIPPEIARALAYLATKPTPETVTEVIDQENTPLPSRLS